MTYTVLHGNEYMKMREDGCLFRPAIGMTGCSEQWRIVGAVERNNFGHVTRRYSLREVQTTAIPWQFKNGKQRTFIQDFDHGTFREWRSPNHKVYSVARVEQDGASC